MTWLLQMTGMPIETIDAARDKLNDVESEFSVVAMDSLIKVASRFLNAGGAFSPYDYLMLTKTERVALGEAKKIVNVKEMLRWKEAIEEDKEDIMIDIDGGEAHDDKVMFDAMTEAGMMLKTGSE